MKILYGVICADIVGFIDWYFVRGLLMVGFTLMVWFALCSGARGRGRGVGRAIGRNHYWRLFRRMRSHPVT